MGRIKCPAPGEQSGGQDDRYHKAAGPTGRHLNLSLVASSCLRVCRECGDPTLETSGDVCPRCWRKRAIERAILRWRRLLRIER